MSKKDDNAIAMSTGNPGDDRVFRVVSIGDLKLNHMVQRDVRQAQVDRIAQEFNWNLFEVPTVSPDLTVIEGGQRVLAGQTVHPGAHVMVAVVQTATTDAIQAEIARGISKPRTRTVGYQDWKMRLTIGYERERMAYQVLRERDLRLGERGGGREVLTCVKAIDSISQWRSVDLARGALVATLDVIIAAWPSVFHQQNRWNSDIVRTVGYVFIGNPGASVEMEHLIEVLARRTPRQWLSWAKERRVPGGPSVMNLLGAYLIDEYNTCSSDQAPHLYWDTGWRPGFSINT